MKSKLMIIAVIMTMLFMGCTKGEQTKSKNMEQIYLEAGIPVKVTEMQPLQFKLDLSYSATLSGLRQSTASAMVGGRIDKVLVKVGDYVEKDQVMFEFPEDAPSGQLRQARAAFALAESTYHRMQNLYEKGGISKQDLDSVQTQYEVAKANLDIALQMLKVRAPISGYVISVNVRETDGVKAETALAVIADTRKMKAKVWITEKEIGLIKPGQITQAIWNGITLEGKVKDVDLAQDYATRAFGVDLEFANPGNLCKSGVIADIYILSYTNDHALLVPRKNISSDEKGSFVFVVENNTAHKRYVQTGKENGNFEILSGLNNGDRVITEGLNLVYDGAKVKIVAKGN
ncbi:MAG TPA: efflux RND transporter periplasmic adaptor subunit [Candidatus Cloacimonadota bacterium]|nr:efflux RND transporter periplasmic adaptor subunit [Candidatus Cloacimonadota bacterium]